MDIFTSFKQVPYTFLKLGQGGIYGNGTLESTDAYGVFKLRRGVTQGSDLQNATSSATLHIKPSEAFLEGLESIEGNGVEVAGKKYRIIGVTEGMNFQTGRLEHYTLTLQVEA